ncbi:SpoIIE family protein phosphatase [Streptomyces sp. PA03-1a]|nr:SpoIIE family protein phosphatase [Streptomyces sp. PA03-1a]MDX2815790.1 SpoIIE family protein phosphatase [Streptomyces sp. PA03-5A]
MDTVDGASAAGTPALTGGPAAFVVDAAGLVSRWSPAAERLLGYATADVVGRPVSELCPVLPWDCLQQMLLATGTASTPWLSTVLMHRHGRAVPVALMACSVTSVLPGSKRTVILASAGPLPEISENEAVRSWLDHHEHLAAVDLRRRMETVAAPDHSAAEITRSYLPARSGTGVNGSWIDVVPLSGMRVAFSVGDVSVSGVQATVCIGLIGAAVRALSELDLAPEEVLARLDDIVSRYAAGRHNEWSVWFVERLVGATFLYAVWDPVGRRCVVASAGHPPPAVADRNGLVHVLDAPGNRPLGMGEPVFEPLNLELAEGSTLLFYTGSLVRACGTNDGVPRLLRTAMQRSGPSVEDVCREPRTSRRRSWRPRTTCRSLSFGRVRSAATRWSPGSCHATLPPSPTPAPRSYGNSNSGALVPLASPRS